MQLGKKTNIFKSSFSPTPKSESKKSIIVDWNIYCVDTSAELIHGKYQGATLAWVMKNDDWYYNWILENNIIAEWGLYRLKENIRKEYNHFVSATGQVWIELRLIENVKGIYSPFL